MCLLVASSAWLTGCSAGDDVISGMNSEIEPAPTHGQAGAQPPGPPAPGGQSNALMVTPRQRAYLDALRSEGVRPTSDLSALSIGSYVCQARAAKQPDQAVWEFVAPLVRNDASDPRSDGHTGKPSASELHDETADYIRIATDRLC
ncbi:hypothetical protein EV589_0699 [Mycobacterium sp. BK558]|uniref:DUF732 domain-containing protein n=1 Tax=Mycolicibacterium chlorophenolicum TaxID=37916 RepID=A0A0J6VL00_9MYCO|nr:DUF732 domain-containing protein [Mycolicibacterium chlorophenolicum]KMO70133.1 hypothetical protein MCHLDSM_05021 [Mycolicibacterium chlorophenolicum]RZT24977.1 hypothetical protein EV589_0699 [Mycobacterium sp. BK558]